jgi:hypothetical protein
MLFIAPNELRSDGSDSRIHLGHRMVPVVVDLNDKIGRIAEFDAYLELSPKPDEPPILLVLMTIVIPAGIWTITLPEDPTPQNNIMLSAMGYTLELNPHDISIEQYSNAAEIEAMLSEMVANYTAGL